MLEKLLNKDSQEYKDYLRNKREPLLYAFDVYKSNVTYGVISETATKHKEIVKWYQSILDLNEDAINNVPTEIEKYL